MDLTKFSTEDLLALKVSDLSKMSTEGLMELKRQQSGSESIAQENLKALDGKGPVDDLMALSHDIGKDVKAGYSGIADLISGNGLDKARGNVDRVEDEKEPTTRAGYMGEALGSQFTPSQIALQAGFGKIAEMIGPWAGNLLKSWGEKAALNAVGMIKSIAETLNVDLSAVAQFLLKPITIGAKTFEPIVTATSSTKDMLTHATEIQAASGKEIERIATVLDDKISGAIAWAEENAVDDSVPFLELKKLVPAIQELKEKAVGGLEDVAPDVAAKFDHLMANIGSFTTKQESGPMATAFSDLAHLKTKLGNLTNFASGTENNLAMQQSWGVISTALKDAAEAVGGEIGKEYLAANAVYHQVTAIIAALTGKETKFALKDIFAPGAFSLIGSVIGGLPGMVAGAAVGAAANTYGHQAIAQGLTKGAPLVAGAIKLTARGIPVVGNAIAQGLLSHEE